LLTSALEGSEWSASRLDRKCYKYMTGYNLQYLWIQFHSRLLHEFPRSRYKMPEFENVY